MATRSSTHASAQLLGDLFRRLGATPADAREATALARERTGARAAPPSARGIELIARVAELLGRVALDHPWRRSDVDRILETVAQTTGLPPELVRLEVHARVTRDPRIIALSPLVAVETELKAFLALTGVGGVSLWMTSEGAGLGCVVSAGPEEPGRRDRLVARAVLAHAHERERSADTYGLPVVRWQRAEAALVFRTSDTDAGAALAAAKETSAALTLVLERETLLRRSSARERALVEGGERLLARLGFDLHDGAIQDVAALAGDLRLLRRQLEDALPSGNGSAPLVGRVDDLEARVLAVDGALREIVHSLESPTVVRRPLDQVLRREVESFGRQADIEVDLALRGEFSELSDSQRIALIRIVQESLTNAREHGGATKVSVSVAHRPNEIAAEITDNGRGFDVERTLVRAARRGRVGLVGMSERARLLGGSFDVRSDRGGPTTVSVVLPAWRPAAVEPAADEARHVLSIG